MLKDWLQRFYQDTVNVRTMRESELSRMEAKGVWVPMGAIILTHISTSLDTLLFTHVKSGLFEGVF